MKRSDQSGSKKGAEKGQARGGSRQGAGPREAGPGTAKDSSAGQAAQEISRHPQKPSRTAS